MLVQRGAPKKVTEAETFFSTLWRGIGAEVGGER